MAGWDDTPEHLGARLAIKQVARGEGLPTELTILSERWNTVAALGEEGVIAKAATLAHLAKRDPALWMAQEVRVCVELSRYDVGSHIHYLTDEPVQYANGLPVTLWYELGGETGGSSERDLVESLAKHNQVDLRDTITTPWFAVCTMQIEETIDILEERGVTNHATIRTLRDWQARLLDAVINADVPDGFIHGDAQRKNAIETNGGPVWIDFEECCIGPFAWDLACLTMNRRFDRDRVLRQYAEFTGSPLIRSETIETLQRLRDLEAVTWMLAIQDYREPAFATEAATLLASVLQVASAD